jgi:hypothetical protein
MAISPGILDDVTRAQRREFAPDDFSHRRNATSQRIMIHSQAGRFDGDPASIRYWYSITRRSPAGSTLRAAPAAAFGAMPDRPRWAGLSRASRND